MPVSTGKAPPGAHSHQLCSQASFPASSSYENTDMLPGTSARLEINATYHILTRPFSIVLLTLSVTWSKDIDAGSISNVHGATIYSSASQTLCPIPIGMSICTLDLAHATYWGFTPWFCIILSDSVTIRLWVEITGIGWSPKGIR